MYVKSEIVTMLDGRTKAFARVWLDHKVMIDSVKLIAGENGLFVAMPSEKSNNGKYYSLVKIEDKNLYQQIEGSVIDAYTAKFS